MNIVEIANYYMNLVIFATIMIVAVLASFMYYAVKVKKIAASEEKIDYSTFKRISALEYCKFDDIVSDESGKGLAGAGMIVMDHSIFVTGIDVVGYNYEYASAGEKQRTMINAIAFASIMEQPLQLRQTVRSIDIGYNIEQFRAAREKAVKELIELKETYADMVAQAEARRDDWEVLQIILGNLKQLERKIHSAEWKIKEADNVIRYEKILQERNNNTERINQVLFSYIYNPDEHTEKLSGEEVLIKAMSALRTKISVYTAALENCGCACKPLDADMLVGLIYRHMHPNTADMVNIRERMDIETKTLYVSSDSLYELEKEKVGEEAFSIQWEKMETVIQEESDRAACGRRSEAERMEKAAASYMAQILQEDIND